MKKFVVINKDILLPGNIKVEENDIGIIKDEGLNVSTIFSIRNWHDIELNNNDFDLFDIKSTGDSYAKKVCNVCNKLLDSSGFDRNQNGVNNRPVRRPSCKDCRKTIDGVALSSRDKKEWGKIKPDLEPFECPICLKRTIPGLTSKVVLDHNHTDGTARAWICDSCNTGIGRFKDDIAILNRAIDFLETKDL